MLNVDLWRLITIYLLKQQSGTEQQRTKEQQAAIMRAKQEQGTVAMISMGETRQDNLTVILFLSQCRKGSGGRVIWWWWQQQFEKMKGMMVNETLSIKVSDSVKLYRDGTGTGIMAW